MTILLPNDEVIVSYDATTEEPIMAAGFTLGANIVNNGNGYQGAYVSTDGQLIQLGGMIRNTVALAVGATLIKLHGVMAPIQTELSTIGINGVSYPAEIDSLGNVTTKVAIGVGGTISLNAIRFLSKEVFAPPYTPDEEEPIEPFSSPFMNTAELELLNGFTNYNEAIYGKATVSWNGDGIIYVRGLLKAPTGTIANNTVMARIPNQATGVGLSAIFHQNTKGGSVRVDIKTVEVSHADITFNNLSGNIVEWVSLAGINYDCLSRG